MKFNETRISGVFEIQIEPVPDERGFFARTWCREEFAAHGLASELAQGSISFSPRKGTLRGLHYQVVPHGEAKVIRCSRGAVYDVALDLRPSSPTFRGWFDVILDSEKRNMLYIPQGCAHGFLTLQQECEVLYLMSEPYDADSARGVRWNDPAFGIAWPDRVELISDRDRNFPDFRL